MARSNPGAYFDQYPGFEPDPQRPLEEEFRRLARFKGWSNKGKKIAQERDAFLLAQFYVHLGAVERSKRLEDWQGLCRELRIDPIPRSIKQCKMALSTKVHVNLVDLLNSRRLGTIVNTFKTRQDLVRYTRSAKKYFPRDEAKEDGLLRILLRKIL